MIRGEAPRIFYLNTNLASKDTLWCGAHDKPRSFNWCEANCPKYYSCDTIAAANNETKLLDGEAWECASCRSIVCNSDDTCSRCQSSAASMYRMEITLQHTEHQNDYTTELIVIGFEVELLKNDLNWIILDAVKTFYKESGSFAVDITYTKFGDYVDNDEITCFCNLKEKIVMY